MRRRSVRSLDAWNLRNERRPKDVTRRDGRRDARVQSCERVVTSGERSSEDGPGPHLVLAYAIRQTHLRLGRD